MEAWSCIRAFGQPLAIKSDNVFYQELTGKWRAQPVAAR
jgi:hypothetical protein